MRDNQEHDIRYFRETKKGDSDMCKSVTRRFLLVLAISLMVCAITALPACTGAAPAPATPSTPAAPKFKGEITLPVVLDMTGPNSPNVVPLLPSFKDLAAYWNDELGGIGGYHVNVKYYDDKYDQAVVLSLYKEIVAGGAQFATFVASTPATTLKSAVNRDKVVVLAWANTDGAYLGAGETNNYGFLACPPYADIFATYVDFVASGLWPKTGKSGKPIIGGFNMDNSAGRQADKGVKLQCDARGLTYVPTFFKPGSAEHTSQILALKQAGVDYVTGIQLGSDTLVFFKDCARLDYKPVVGFHAAHDTVLMKAGYATGTWNYYVSGGADSKGYTIMKKYHDMHDPGQPMSAMYQAGFIYNVPMHVGLDRAIKRVGLDKLTGTAIKEDLEKIRMEDLTDGLCYKYNYTTTDHRSPFGVKWAKMLDAQGTLEWGNWVAFPERTGEQITTEFWKK